MKILLIATRDIGGLQSGRKMVLRTIVRSCESLGHHIDVVVIGPPDTNPRSISISGPRVGEVFMNLLRHFVLGHKSLNECLYWSDHTQQELDRLVDEGSYDVVVSDMIRTAQYCAQLRVPWILDLDDLLSDRYARLAETPDSRMLLGYFSERLPAPLRRAAAVLAGRLLRVEAKRVASQEVYFSQNADVVTLVSPVEAGKLARQLGRPVHDTAMGIDIPAPSAVHHESRQRHAVAFLGGLDYQPNIDAIQHYLDHIAPELERRGCDIELHVVGNAPVALRPADPSARTVYLGYVDNLAATMNRYSVFAAPIVTGGGIKVKVLEAMASGLAVVATEQAVVGLGVTHQRECLVASTPEEFANGIAQLIDDSARCARIGNAARAFVDARFSHPVLREKWRRLLDDAVNHHGSGHAPAPAPI